MQYGERLPTHSPNFVSIDWSALPADAAAAIAAKILCRNDMMQKFANCHVNLPDMVRPVRSALIGEKTFVVQKQIDEAAARVGKRGNDTGPTSTLGKLAQADRSKTIHKQDLPDYIGGMYTPYEAHTSQVLREGTNPIPINGRRV